MDPVTSRNESEGDTTSSGETTPTDNHTQQTSKRKHAHRFVEWDRQDQLDAFFTWLPTDLHDAPGIDWSKLPPQVRGYCVCTASQSPDAAMLALAAASAHGSLTTNSLLSLVGAFSRLFVTLRSQCGLSQYPDLRNEELWLKYAVWAKQRDTTAKLAKSYASIVSGHFPRYLQRLTSADRQRMQQYTLPPLPPDFQKKMFPNKRIRAQQQIKRKAQSDILVPLYPVLRQLVRFRKQLAERTLLAIREARCKVEAGEATLPYHFQHHDAIPKVNRDARSISEVQILGRQVTMHFTLWDKPTWVAHHRDRYASTVRSNASTHHRSYVQGQNCFFVEFTGDPKDLLWFGDLIEHRLLQHLKKAHAHTPAYEKSWQLARQLGFHDGCQCSRAGLLGSSDIWFPVAAWRGHELIFEPESLYRGVLFGAALAMISLSNGSRVSELLQVSWNKERRVTRTETVIVLGEDGRPLLREDGTPLTKQVKIHLQYLLPKGAKTEEERQLFPLSKEVMKLLAEIKVILEQAHGEIPVVQPTRSSSKYEHLKPEQYFFQWSASPDGKSGLLSVDDVCILLRFIFHGLDLFTTTGEPIRVSAHILRHVMATHARHIRNVPPEAIAYFFLYHRLKRLTGREPSSSEISDYYFQMTEEQRFALIRVDLDEQEEMDRPLLSCSPTTYDLEHMNEDLRASYEVWHTLHPTALGNCGNPGLCPREKDRALCLDCCYLITDPERMGVALSWRASYAKQTEQFESQGNSIDARQARIKVQQLDDVINVMRLQQQAEADGSYIPLYKVLPSPYRKREDGHEEAN